MVRLHSKYHATTDPVNYIICTPGDYTSEKLAEIESACLGNTRSARYNNDGTKCILKYRHRDNGNIPSEVSSLTSYSFSEIEKILRTSEWDTDVEDESET